MKIIHNQFMNEQKQFFYVIIDQSLFCHKQIEDAKKPC